MIPEPKPVLIALLTVPGILWGLAAGWDVEGEPDRLAIWMWIGGSMALPIGVTLALSRRFWMRLYSAPVLGFGISLCVLWFRCWSTEGEIDMEELGQWSLTLALPVATSMIMLHHGFLVCSRWKTRAAFIPLYLLAGALSMLTFWVVRSDIAGWLNPYPSRLYLFDPLGEWDTGWTDWLRWAARGAAFGLLQWTGAAAALAFDRRSKKAA
jgi:hypothetical protein